MSATVGPLMAKRYVERMADGRVLSMARKEAEAKKMAIWGIRAVVVGGFERLSSWQRTYRLNQLPKCNHHIDGLRRLRHTACCFRRHQPFLRALAAFL